MPHLPLLVNLAVGLSYALLGGLIARRIGLPAIVGYLVAGVAIGPFTPGFHGDEESIHQLAEFGVILLMFSIGMHFSFKDLWQVRDIAIPGALLQAGIATGLGYALARSAGATPAAAFVLGAAISVASTVVLLRALMDTGLLDTLHGRVAIGWLVFEDLLTVAILVLLPLFALPVGGDSWREPMMAVGKAALFVTLMLTVGPRLVPLIMVRVVQTRSRELFVLVALTAAVGTALLSATYFGVSIALGAFLAGVVFGESEFSHQVSADLLPFREAFAVLFFVSVGMLVDPGYLIRNWIDVIEWSVLVVVGKYVITVGIGFFFPYPARTSIVVASGLAQIGEFSFILGQAGLALDLITNEQYSLILAAAIVSITLNPLVLRTMAPVEAWLRRWPAVWKRLDRPRDDVLLAPRAGMSDHVIIVGCGRVGRHIAEALGRLNIERVVIESDPARLSKLRELGVPALYGDAGSSEILEQASLDTARALVITVPDDAVAMAVAHAAHEHAPNLLVVARASTWEGARRLNAAGVKQVVRPELEGGVEIVRRTLLGLDLPIADVQRYAEMIRREGLDETSQPNEDLQRMLDALGSAGPGVDMTWVDVGSASSIDGQTIGAAAFRTKTGASIVALSRSGQVEVNPAPDTVLVAGDRLAVIGTSLQVRDVMTLAAHPVT